ncbi:hypothetical protein Lser_V15G09477 [Lactuca serriola]
MYRFLNTLSSSYLSLIIPHDFHTQTLSIMKRLQGNRYSPSSSLSSFVTAEQPTASTTAITPFYDALLPSLYEKKPKTFYHHHIDASPAESIVTTTTSSSTDPKQNLNQVINSIQKTLGTIHRLYLTVSSFNQTHLLWRWIIWRKGTRFEADEEMCGDDEDRDALQETIKNMQAITGARIQVISLHPPPGDTSTERAVQIDGSSEQIEPAKQLVNEVISKNRPRNSMGSGGGGYSQQGYLARPQTNTWAPPAPQMQQQGYGYMQPGAYPGQPAQYSQPQYGGYPRSAGYVANWDRSAPHTQPPGGTVAAADGSGYGYSQQGQGYSQDGYGGYSQSGYAQGYDQQGYGNPIVGYNETSNGQTGQTDSYGGQADTTVAQAPPPAFGAQSSYVQPPPPAAASYGSYGAQPPFGYGGYGQKPPVTPQAYGQPPPQQSPNAAPQGGGYAKPAPYSGYGQADASGQRPPYGGAAAGYAQAAYGQQPAAAAYGGSYGGGYPQQPPAYAGETAAPATQASQGISGGGGAVAKASPQQS